MNLSFSQLECPLKENTQFFFMHIGKTAGTTLLQIVEQQFDEKEVARWLYPFHLRDRPTRFFTKHRYFHGHIEYSVMCSFLPQQPVTMTMLREPVERYLSHFGSHQRLSQLENSNPEILNQFQQTPLDRFVSDPPEILIPLAHQFRNVQATMLAFEFQPQPGKPREELHRLIETGYMLPAPKFERARQHLDQLAFVGLTERFQDSLFLMAYTFGWVPVVEYKSLNLAPPRPSRAQLSPELVEQLNTVNQIDLAVYEYGRQLFETRYQKMSYELLERYGRRKHAHLKLPLSKEVMVELLDAHYRRRFVERNSAVPTFKFRFDRKISGWNWQVLEQDPVHGAFRWSGPGRCATLDLPLAATSDIWLRFSVARAITEEVLASLVVKVNDEQIQVGRRRLENGATICEGYVPQAVLVARPGCVRVSFEVAKTVMPLEVIPDSEDDRLLAIAVNWVEVEPALPLLEECTA